MRPIDEDVKKRIMKMYDQKVPMRKIGRALRVGSATVFRVIDRCRNERIANDLDMPMEK